MIPPPRLASMSPCSISSTALQRALTERSVLLIQRVKRRVRKTRFILVTISLSEQYDNPSYGFFGPCAERSKNLRAAERFERLEQLERWRHNYGAYLH